MLLTALSGAMPDRADAVCVGERRMSREALYGAAAALAMGKVQKRVVSRG